MKNILFRIIIILTYCLAMFALILLLSKNMTASRIILVVSLCLLFVIYATNSVIEMIKSKQQINYALQREKILEQKEEVENNFKSYQKKVRQAFILSACYLALLYSLSLLIAAASFACMLYYSSVVILAFLLLFCFSLMLCMVTIVAFYSPIPNDIPPHILIEEHKYPHLMSVAKRAAQASGSTGQFQLMVIPGDNVGVRLVGNQVVLVVGIDVLGILNSEELYAVLLHEFAHIMAGDATKRKRSNDYVNSWLVVVNKIAIVRVLIKQMYFYLSNTLGIYDFLTSYRLEVEADKQVIKLNANQEFINAVAKINLWELHSFLLPEQNLAKESVMPTDFMESRVRVFKQSYYKNKDNWEKMCKQQLPAKIDTHPNLPERMKNFGISDLTVDFEIKEDDFFAERRAIEQIVQGEFAENWSEMHQNEYAIHKRYVELYESKMPQISLSEVANSYMYLCEYEKALELYNSVLEVQPSNNEAKIKKAILLCNKQDVSAIDLLVELLDDFNYCERAMQQLAEFIRFMGMKEERDKLRPIIYSKIDKMLSINMTDFSEISASSLQQEEISELSTALKSMDIAFAFVFKKHIRKEKRNTLVLCYNNISDEKKRCRINQLLILLADKSIKVDLYVFENAFYMQPLIKKLYKKRNYRLI